MATAPITEERRAEQDDPFRLGWRYQKVVLPNGTEDTEIVPLREEDLLYPQEEDFVVQNDLHITDVFYLLMVFRARTAGNPGIRVLGDHRIDFQHGGVRPLGPDVAVLNGEPLPWDGSRGTFPVRDMKARALFVIEVTSPNTRAKDIGPKLNLYYRAGVPLYVIADPPYGGSETPVGIMAFQAGPEFYESLPIGKDGRFWLEVVNVWLGIEDGRVACYDADGKRIGGYEEVNAELQKEKARADAAEARLRELEARIKKPKRRKK